MRIWCLVKDYIFLRAIPWTTFLSHHLDMVAVGTRKIWLKCQPWQSFSSQCSVLGLCSLLEGSCVVFYLGHLFMMLINGSSISTSFSPILNDEMVSVCKNNFTFKSYLELVRQGSSNELRMKRTFCRFFSACWGASPVKRGLGKALSTAGHSLAYVILFSK